MASAGPVIAMTYGLYFLYQRVGVDKWKKASLIFLAVCDWTVLFSCLSKE